MPNYKGPASLDELRRELRSNDEFEYIDDQEYADGVGWVFFVRRRADKTTRQLLYTNSESGSDDWLYSETLPWARR
jgi:hypothetical protein